MQTPQHTRGQVTVEGIIYTFISLLLLIGLQPALNNVISTALGQSDDFTSLILSLIIPLMFIGIIWGFLKYAFPSRTQNNRYD